jgi:hypothetical protein
VHLAYQDLEASNFCISQKPIRKNDKKKLKQVYNYHWFLQGLHMAGLVTVVDSASEMVSVCEGIPAAGLR